MDDQHQKTPDTDKNQETSHRSRVRSAERSETPEPARNAMAADDDRGPIADAVGVVSDLVGNDTMNRATAMVRNMGEQAWSAASNAGGTAQELARQARDQVSGMMSSGSRAGDYVARNVNEYPLTAVLIAGAVGYGLAYLFHNNWQTQDAPRTAAAKEKNASSANRK